jgi:hypothetical protein
VILTIFTAPKPFINPHIINIQRNAIRCWQHLEGSEVFLVGDEPGIAATATELGVKHLPGVVCNVLGTPLIGSIFNMAQQAASSSLLVYTNADMLFTSDLVQAAQQVSTEAQRFLMVGQRWDLDVTQPLDFIETWQEDLRNRVHTQGHLHLAAGSDYFLFPRGLFTNIPDFTVGRAGWDNWMIYHTRQQGWPVIDATPSVMAIHQNHDYSHLPGGLPHYNLPESSENAALAGGVVNLFTILDTDKQLIDGKISPPRITPLRLLRWAEMYLTPQEGKGNVVRKWLARRFRRLRRRITGSL